MDQQNMNNDNAYQPPVQAENVPKKGKGFSTAALVLGIIGVCFSFIPILNNIAFVVGVLAVIFGAMALVKKVGKKQAIVSIILGVLAIVITLVMQAALAKAIDDAFNEFNNEMEYINGGKTEEILKKYLDVTIGTFQVIEGEYYDDTKLEVTVKNKGSETSNFSIEIEAVDANGYRLGTDYIYVSNLRAGQGQKFDLFTFVTSDKLAQYKQATFKIVTISKY